MINPLVSLGLVAILGIGVIYRRRYPWIIVAEAFLIAAIGIPLVLTGAYRTLDPTILAFLLLGVPPLALVAIAKKFPTLAKPKELRGKYFKIDEQKAFGNGEKSESPASGQDSGVRVGQRGATRSPVAGLQRDEKDE